MIQIFSSFANDIITYQNDAIISGGPAFWIEKALQNLSAEYQIHTGTGPGKVSITKNRENEDVGTILCVKKIPFILPSNKDIILISTLKQEFDLKNLKNLQNTIFLDVQGYLRGEGGKIRFNCEQSFSQGKIYIKSTREEFLYLDNPEQQNLIHIITNGGKNIEIFGENIRENIVIRSGDFSDTIGAGDTFLASVAYYFAKTQDIIVSIEKASEDTFVFLEQKNSF